MSAKIKAYGFLGIKIVVAAIFAAAGLAKLAGVQMMVDSFDMLGFGQWFRYVTGIIEVSSAALLFTPNKQAYGAALLVCTMVGAVLAHIFILGPSAVPALVLGLLSALILFVHREQIIPN